MVTLVSSLIYYLEKSSIRYLHTPSNASEAINGFKVVMAHFTNKCGEINVLHKLQRAIQHLCHLRCDLCTA